ncbi:MAG: FHA domain-containing protein [Polyangiaceae bacterium]|nr:FHA domain-containing protein [Polyangiaceae bacterium]
MDEARFELRLRGRAVAVQPKVLDLVLYLAKNRDRVVTKDELLDTVWKGIAVTEASLSQAVSLARRALDDSPEEQHTLRTVRSRGLQFVAEALSAETPSPAPKRATTPTAVQPAASLVARPGIPSIGTLNETFEDKGAGVVTETKIPFLFAALHCEAPALGGAAWSLAGIDEVEIGRGSERRSTKTGGATQLLTIAAPGRLMSRKHARITRTPHGWLVVDEGSKNGTFVRGQRVDKHLLSDGDVVDCGRTLFRFSTERRRTEPTNEADIVDAGAIFASVTPWVLDLERDLRRIAASDVPVLLLGESGTGKSHVADAIHRLSGRTRLIRIEADARVSSNPDRTTEDDAGGGPTTLLIENLERAGDAALARLQRALDAAPDVRVVATSLLGRAALAERFAADLRTRLGSYVCELPPLRLRIGDLGALAAKVMDAALTSAEFDIEAARALLEHPWPGNVRELSHRLKMAATLSAGGLMRIEHLFPEPT